MNASYQASLVNRHIRRFTGTFICLYLFVASPTERLHLQAKSNDKTLIVHELYWNLFDRVICLEQLGR